MYMIVIGFSKYHQLSEVITMLHIAFKNALLFFFFFFNPLIYFWQHWVFIAACRLSVVVASRSYSSLNEWLLTEVASLVVEHGL